MARVIVRRRKDGKSKGIRVKVITKKKKKGGTTKVRSNQRALRV